jgi:hypothetical protein
MITIDSLVHNFLHRTGALHQLDAAHPYGPVCYGPNGCADLLEGLARHVDAWAFNPEFPAYFPRFIQNAICRFCAAGERNICNGNQIADGER